MMFIFPAPKHYNLTFLSFLVSSRSSPVVNENRYNPVPARYSKFRVRTKIENLTIITPSAEIVLRSARGVLSLCKKANLFGKDFLFSSETIFFSSLAKLQKLFLIFCARLIARTPPERLTL